MVCDVPTHVHGDVLPAEGFQILGHEFCAVADVGFGNGFAVSVPTVPAHGRSGSEINCFVRSTDGGAALYRQADREDSYGGDQETAGESGNEKFCGHVCVTRRG
jgi:hypothetical protein